MAEIINKRDPDLRRLKEIAVKLAACTEAISSANDDEVDTLIARSDELVVDGCRALGLSEAEIAVADVDEMIREWGRALGFREEEIAAQLMGHGSEGRKH